MEMKENCCTNAFFRSSSKQFLNFHSYLKQILISFILLLSALQVSAAFSNDVHKDLHQLLSFKASLPNSSSLLQDWSLSPTTSNNNLCNFTGVSCKNSRVSSIDLSNFALSIDFDSVSTYLITLQNLESLVLKNTNISGLITSIKRSQCGALLNSVDLAQNSISGPVSDILGFSVCSSIFSLNLSANSMDPPVIKQNRVSSFGVQVLDLSHNNISGPDVLQWLLSSQFSELKYLSVKGNRLAGEIPLLDLKNLSYLDLSMNNFSTGFPSFGDCSNLEHLDLSSNKFYGGGDVSTSLSSCRKLSFLNLTHNQLTGSVPKLGSKSLQFLYLKQNDFHGEIPPHLSELCSSLLVLDLSSNNLSGTVPDSLGSCSSLEILDISNNSFSSELPMKTLFKMNNLKNLVLGFNNFSGTLPESLSNFVNLETFDVSSNYISGLIPPGICQNNLKVLYLQNNLLTGIVPESLSNCTQLVSLDLSFNYLTGKIPSSLGSLSKLKDLIAWSNQLNGEIPEELTYLQSLENLILDFNDLNGSIPASLSNCSNLNWISLSNNLLSGQIPASLGRLEKLAILKLGNNSLSGSIPPELGDCSLLWLDLNTNTLSGAIPSALFKQSGNIPASFLTGKWYMYIKNDGSKECHGAGNLLEFGGIREGQLDRISTRHPCNFSRVYRGKTQPTFNHNGSMIFLDLSYNMLEGSIPLELGSLYYLFVLNLGHNDLSGPIPNELDGLKNLAILDLSYNRLNGSIPNSLTGLRVGELDLSNNNLSGRIPESNPFDTSPENKFFNNSGLCGNPLPPCGTVFGSVNTNQHHLKSRRGLATLAGSVAMGILFSLLFIFSLIVVAMEIKKREEREAAALEDPYVESNSLSATAKTTWKLSARDLSINLSTFEKPLMNLTLADLLVATNNFHSDSLIGSGGFGDVYKANLKDGSVVAIKKLIHVSGQGDREFTAEMETIGRIKHPNLVPLLGYCKVREERLLVYEYMKYGSLEDVLHDRKKIGIKLNWSARRKIAIGAARGLAFLHHNCNPHIIHRDMKSSNVLLDEKLEARVSDFGMARRMSAVDTHLSVSTLAGTPGYVPPEYYQSFRCSTRGDVYSYGVVLLELLTGKQPTDSSDFGDNNNLVGWVKQQHTKVRKITDVFDQDLLKEDPSLEIELLQHLKVACSCLDDRPWKRPTMIQVLARFKEIQAGGSSAAAAAGEDGYVSAVEGIEMSIREGNDDCSKHV